MIVATFLRMFSSVIEGLVISLRYSTTQTELMRCLESRSPIDKRCRICKQKKLSLK